MQSSSIKKERIAKWDNAKCFLIFLVVLGHFADYYSSSNVRTQSLFFAIYLFHMPAFFFLSGLFCKHYGKDDRLPWEKILPFYFLSVALNYFRVLTQRPWNPSLDFQLFKYSNVSWYLFALFTFYLLCYLLRNLPCKLVLLMSLILALITGYVDDVGSTLAFYRIGNFFFYFYLGYVVDPERLKIRLEKGPAKIGAGLIMAIYLIVCYKFCGILYPYRKLITGANSYAATIVGSGPLSWAYHLIDICFALIVTMAFLSLVPLKKIPCVTTTGKRTLAVYFWHFAFIELLVHNRFFNQLISINNRLLLLAFLICSFLIVAILSFRIFSVPLTGFMHFSEKLISDINDGSDSQKQFEMNIISKYRNPIYGFCIFWITLFHAHAINKVDYSFGQSALKLLKLIMNTGNVGVDCFLFLSGICLYFSFHRKPDVMAFEKKRARRVIVPSLLILGIYWVLILLLNHDVRRFIYRITLIEFWIDGDQAIWFVSLILILYLLYPVFYKLIYFKDSDRGVLTRTVILLMSLIVAVYAFSVYSPERFALYEIALMRVPIFVLGCGLGKAVYEARKVRGSCRLIPLIFTGFFFYSVYAHLPEALSFNNRVFYFAGGLGIPYCLAYLFEYLTEKGTMRSKTVDFFTFLGTFSLEIYLSAGMWNQLLRKTDFYQMGTLPLYLVMLLIAYAFAYVIYRLETIIFKYIDTKKITLREV